MPLTIAAETYNTPTAAKALAKAVSEACFNDEIRAIVAAELLRRIVDPSDDAVSRAHKAAWQASSALVVAYDRQFTD